jgi:hypothetical protein
LSFKIRIFLESTPNFDRDWPNFARFGWDRIFFPTEFQNLGGRWGGARRGGERHEDEHEVCPCKDVGQDTDDRVEHAGCPLCR